MAEPKDIQAAGAVVWRNGQEDTEVLLIHRPKRGDWSLAKGKRDPGEHLLQTAVREVFEETGVRPVLGRRLRTVGYEVNGAPKWVHYWAAAAPAMPVTPATSADPAASTPWFSPNAEVDQIEWLTFPRARERLTYTHDTWVLNAFARWPRETVPLILLRHATAGDKKHWHGEDLERPLDEAGRAEARALAGVLACFAPRRVISSPAVRCLETVQPYAAQIGAAVETEAAFLPPGRLRDSAGNPTNAGDPAATMKRIVAAADPTVVCVHRENIPALLAAACEQLGTESPARPAVPKGGFWALHIGGTRLTAVERYTLSGG